LALGIGSNAAIFSVLNAAIIEPLPLPDSDRIVTAFGRTKQSARTWMSYPDFQEWKKQSKTLEAISASVGQSVNLTGREEPQRLIGNFVSADFFQLAGVPPLRGRVMRPGEDQPGAALVAVVSERAWQNIFGADPQLTGKTLVLNNEPYEVIGIVPENYQRIFNADVYLPYHKWPNFSQDRKQASVWALARLREGVELSEARAESETIFAQLAQQFPDTNADRQILLMKFHDLLAEEVTPSLLLLAGAVALVLLIACGNVAGLLLARGAARQKELATRVALGAGRARLVRQLLTESVLLWLAGGALGLLVGYWGAQGLMQIAPSDLPTGNEPAMDWRVLGFTMLVSLLTGILFGLAPALRFSRPDLNESLKESGRTSSGGAARSRLRSALVVAQTALALMLLVGAGLMVRSLLLALQVDPGFDPKNVLTMEYRVPRNKYPEGAQQNEFHQRVVERIRALPGVESACVVRALPLSQNAGRNFVNFTVVGQPEPQPGSEPRALANFADNFFFETFRIPLLRGRTFDSRDHAQSPNVVVINEAMSRRFWPQGDAVGHSIRVRTATPVTATIIGVVGNIKNTGPEESEQLQIYAPQSQFPFIFNTLAVRTKGDPMGMVRDVRAAVWSVDREQPVWAIRTLETLLGRATSMRRFIASLLGGYSALALLLAAIGIYGVVAYSVTQRTHEIGIRMALGAQQKQILQLVLRYGLRLTAIGIGLGIAASLALTQFLEKQLFAVKPVDPLTFVGVPLLLTAVALLACFLPARRATRVDPMVALRYE
ncbi:MAG TPA: ABC transporter permease, partial [Candidatus Nitrosotenuis sp.]|nr:ABC transporter permease [Candidatus Nitrosotenuis sp.]